ncbi:MAG: stage II sporulation protein E [Bacillota bacterium]
MLKRADAVIGVRWWAKGMEKWAALRRWLWLDGLVPMLVAGFLFARAEMLGQFSPFALPFFIVAYFLWPRRWPLVALGMLLGASTLRLERVTALLAGIALVLLLALVWRRRKLGWFKLAVIGFVAVVGGGLLSRFMHGKLAFPDGLYVGVEGVLAAVLAILMWQTVLLLSQRTDKTLRQEEMICLVILLASAVTGTMGWTVSGLTVSMILAQWLVAVFAFAAGGGLGAAVGVVTGLVIGLASGTMLEISMLAFAGLLGGMLKYGGRVSTAIGVFLGATIFALILEQPEWLFLRMLETALAIVLFLLLPGEWMRRLSARIPGTLDHWREEQRYVQRVREVTAQRVRNFARLFERLSSIFLQERVPRARQEEHIMNEFMNDVVSRVCGQCAHRKRCWDEPSYMTVQMLTDMLAQVEAAGGQRIRTDAAWRKHCVKPEVLIREMRAQYPLLAKDLQWRQQLADSRRLVADQLRGLAEVMEKFARDIEREVAEMSVQEAQIKEALAELGLSIRDVQVYSLEEGHVYIEVTQHSPYGKEECERLVAPMLAGLLGEPIAVKEEAVVVAEDGTTTVPLVSDRRFDVQTGVAHAAKGGGLVSGDSFRIMELGPRQVVMAISDGMGNGERARRESQAAVELLQELLRSGFDEQLAIQTINAVLRLRSSDEMYATIDLAMLDLFDGRVKFLKVGSTPTFIKRGKQVWTIHSDTPPLGILQELPLDGSSRQLRPGDILIMMSDGLLTASEPIQDAERWMRRVIRDIQTDDPQAFADLLLEHVVRQQKGEIADDMTVIVARITQSQPEWATIQLPIHQKTWFQRPQMLHG